MRSATEHEYKVLMLPPLAAIAKGSPRWRAMLLDFPSIVEEAASRDQVIKQIKARLADMLAHAEIITLHTPAFPEAANGAPDELTAQGWDDHGLFKDDADALQIFGEIERTRDSHLVGGA